VNLKDLGLYFNYAVMFFVIYFFVVKARVMSMCVRA